MNKILTLSTLCISKTWLCLEIWVQRWKRPKLHWQTETSGIPGGYRLVSTYNLPDGKTILKFEILKFSDWGGGGILGNMKFGLRKEN